MTLKPCHTCHLADGCGIRLEKIRGVRGLKLTAIKFRCEVLKESLQPGMKVRADLKYVCTGLGPDSIGPRTVEAVVMAWSREKVRIYVPYDPDGEWWLESLKTDGHDYVHVLRVFPNQLHPTPERVPVCPRCGLPAEADLEGWSCGEDGCDLPEAAR